MYVASSFHVARTDAHKIVGRPSGCRHGPRSVTGEGFSPADLPSLEVSEYFCSYSERLAVNGDNRHVNELDDPTIYSGYESVRRIKRHIPTVTAAGDIAVHNAGILTMAFAGFKIAI
jgi:hypothetical protein